MKKIFLILVVFSIIISCSKEEKAPKKEKNEYGFYSDTLIEHDGKVLDDELFTDILKPFLPYAEIIKLAEQCKPIFDVKKIRTDAEYVAYVSPDSSHKLMYFVYEIDKVNYVHFSFTDSIPKIEVKEKVVTHIERKIHGEINESLWATMLNMNINPVLAIKMSEILAWQIDFNEIHQGDKFKAIYEDIYIGDEYIGIGKITAVYFEHENEPFYSFRFLVDGNKEEFYNEEGKSTRKAFLKAPLKFIRITSKFSNSRFHPVLRRYRAHHGIDYAAPIGTPVQAIGDGKVISASYQGGAGNFVKIKHNKTFTSGYMHLSRYGKGIKPGKMVKQGDIVGYVGSTGLSTGPHLDFRFWVNGTPVNYLTQKFPSTKPIEKKYEKEFFSMKDSLKTIIDKIGKNETTSSKNVKKK